MKLPDIVFEITQHYSSEVAGYRSNEDSNLFDANYRNTNYLGFFESSRLIYEGKDNVEVQFHCFEDKQDYGAETIGRLIGEGCLSVNLDIDTYHEIIGMINIALKDESKTVLVGLNLNGVIQGAIEHDGMYDIAHFKVKIKS